MQSKWSAGLLCLIAKHVKPHKSPRRLLLSISPINERTYKNTKRTKFYLVFTTSLDTYEKYQKMKIFYKKKYKINSHPLAAHRVVNPALSSTHILLGLVDNYVFKYNYGYVFIISFYGNALLQCLCFIMPL